MLVIPQLGSLANVQFPADSSRVKRTVVNRMEGGETFLYGDAGGSRTVWRLALSGLTDAERQSLESFFRSVEGQLRPFLYLDPFDNLLRQSNQFSSAVWVKEAPLALGAGTTDPFVGAESSSASNPAPAALRIWQSLEIPAWLQYSFSVYLKANGGGAATLALKAGSQEARKTFTLGPAWRRCVLTASPGGTAEVVEAAIEIPAQSAVEIFGAQMEAQPAASDYKSTTATAGVYPGARLLQDELRWVATAPDSHSTVLMIMSR